jgi:hypothetical protein
MKKLALIWIFAFAICCALMGCGKVVALEDERRAEVKWLIAISAGDYLKGGVKDPRWDATVLRGLTNYAHRYDPHPAIYPWRSDINEAVEAGCTDPFVKILHLRADDGWGNCSTEVRMQAWTNAANALENTTYAAMHKFYGNLAAITALRNVTGTNSYAQVNYYYNLAMTYADVALGDPETSAPMTLRIVTDFLKAMRWSRNGREQVVDMAERALLRSHPRTWQTQHLKGVFEDERAWFARGQGYASTVSKEMWAAYYDHLAKAQKQLMKAWRWQPRVETAIRMVNIQLAYGDDRVMESWFQAAMNLNTNSYEAVSAKYYYLSPRWHGSRQAQHEFAASCVKSTKWGGHVPLITLDFHDEMANDWPRGKEDYFGREAVFEEAQAALDRFFELEPEETGWHHNYFWYAYCAKRWDIAKRELALLGDDINYDYFGGEEKFREIVKRVKENATGG